MGDGMDGGLTEAERWSLFGDVMVSRLDGVLGGVEHANLAALHIAIADEAVYLINAGVPAEEVSVLLEITWRKIRDRWAHRDGVTHANASLLLS